jgi:hypothetical protein
MITASWTNPHRRPTLKIVRSNDNSTLDMEDLPISEHSDKNLTNDNARNFQIIDSLNPCLAANFVCTPAFRKRFLKQRFYVANTEQNISIER